MDNSRKAHRRLREGDIALDARLDLHGRTQPEAFEALKKFIASNVKAGSRNLLIITGKGKDGEGVLKANLKVWLESLPESAAILNLRPAAPKHGGDGAFYVMLKRQRDL